MFEQIEDTISRLLSSGESLYSIAKNAGVAYSTVHDLSEKRNYEMVRFKTIKQLYKYAKKQDTQ